MKSFLTSVALSLAIAIAITSPSSCSAEKVCKVHDGDTFTLCSGQRIRIFGIDAPEIKQPMGTASRDGLSALIQDHDVILDCTAKSYDRKVCKVQSEYNISDSTTLFDVGNVMVLKGLAFDFPLYSKGLYSDAQKSAQKDLLGVWQSSNGGEKPWEYRQRIHEARINGKR